MNFSDNRSNFLIQELCKYLQILTTGIFSIKINHAVETKTSHVQKLCHITKLFEAQHL